MPPKWPSRWAAKNIWRPLTTRLPHNILFRIIEWYVPRWIPIDNWLLQHSHECNRFNPLRYAGIIGGLIPCYNYIKHSWAQGLSLDQIKQWAILDTFDALTPVYDQPQEIPVVESWFREANLREIYVGKGAQENIKGNARK